MINGLFEEISEQEIMSVNGGCGGSASDLAILYPEMGWQTVYVPQSESKPVETISITPYVKVETVVGDITVTKDGVSYTTPTAIKLGPFEFGVEVSVEKNE